MQNCFTDYIPSFPLFEKHRHQLFNSVLNIQPLSIVLLANRFPSIPQSVRFPQPIRFPLFASSQFFQLMLEKKKLPKYPCVISLTRQNRKLLRLNPQRKCHWRFGTFEKTQVFERFFSNSVPVLTIIRQSIWSSKHNEVIDVWEMWTKTTKNCFLVRLYLWENSSFLTFFSSFCRQF